MTILLKIHCDYDGSYVEVSSDVEVTLAGNKLPDDVELELELEFIVTNTIPYTGFMKGHLNILEWCLESSDDDESSS